MKDEVIVIQNHTYSTSVCPLVTKMKSFVVAVIIMPVLYGMFPIPQVCYQLVY